MSPLLEKTKDSLDVVVPLWNEEEVLPSLLARLQRTLSQDTLAENDIHHVRLLLVDDGSTDRTAEIIAHEIMRGLPAVLLRLSRNFGHQAAVSAGLEHSRADFVAVLDADLQDPPELIPAMISKAREGFEVVYATRRRRSEGFVRTAGYWAFYRLVASLSDVPIPLDSGDFCLMTRRVVEALKNLPERLRFPRILRAWVGFSQVSLEFDRPERVAGRSKYTMSRLYRLATDGVISASTRPLQLTQVFSLGYLGLLAALTAALLVWPRTILQIGLVPLLVAGVFLVLIGNLIQVFCMYILGAYIGRTYLEVKGRPPYVVMEVVGNPARTDLRNPGPT